MLLPKPFVEKVVNKGAEFVPFVGPAYKYTRKAVKVTKLTNPVSPTSRAVGIIVIACTGPVIKYPALCALWGATAIVGGATANPALLGASLEFSEMLLEELSND
jgi:hypothetical protein